MTKQSLAWWGTWVGLVILFVGTGVYLLSQRIEPPLSLYQYYPANTLLFMDIAPSPTLSHRIVNLIQQCQPLKQGSTEQSKLLDHFLATYERHFQPEVSMGGWIEKQSHTVAVQWLVVLPLKQTTSLQALAQDFGGSLQRFHLETYNGHTLYVAPDNLSALSVDHGHVLLGSNRQDIQKALDVRQNRQPNLLSLPTLQSTLSQLPAPRFGWMMLNSQEMTKLQPTTSPTSQQLSQISPFVVAVLQQHKAFITITSHTPLNLEKIIDPVLRTEVMQVIQQSRSFASLKRVPVETAFYLGFTNLDHYFDLYRQYFLSSNDQKQLAGIEAMLEKAAKISLRKDIVPLFSPEAAIAMQFKQNQPDVLLYLSNNANQADTMAKLMMIASFTEAKSKINTIKSPTFPIHTLTAKSLPFALAYGETSEKLLVLGQEPSVFEVAAIEANPVKALYQQESYQSLMHQLPETGSGIMYINFQQLAKGNPQFAAFPQFATAMAAANTPQGASAIDGHAVIQLTP